MTKKIIIFIISVSFFTYLLISQYIGENTFIVGFSISVLIAIILVDFDKLKEIDLKSLRLVLTNIKEESKGLQELALNVSQLIAMNSGFQGRWGKKEWDDLRDEIQTLKIKKILSLIKDEKNKEGVFRYQNLFDKTAELKNQGKSQWEIEEMITKELKKHLELARSDIV